MSAGDRHGEDTIFVGKKPVMYYVLACLTMFQNGSTEVTLKARGRAISKAVDAAQVTTQRFATDVAVRGIEIDTEAVQDPATGATSDVSSIEIRLGK
ncbi:MAG: DNA-binding protein Alba [Nitrososphaerales archaeon]